MRLRIVTRCKFSGCGDEFAGAGMIAGAADFHSRFHTVLEG